PLEPLNPAGIRTFQQSLVALGSWASEPAASPTTCRRNSRTRNSHRGQPLSSRRRPSTVAKALGPRHTREQRSAAGDRRAASLLLQLSAGRPFCLTRASLTHSRTPCQK